MRKLERTPAPTCLSHFRHGANNWNDVTSEHKAEIWQQLEAMQGKFCAYCERSIRRKSKDSHIEHFFRRRDDRKKEFDWDNLFGSCQGEGTCGDYKDNRNNCINMSNVCKPDTMDPADYLQFLPNGLVQPKPGLAAHEHGIAEATIAAFNLNSINLTNTRKSIYSAELGSVEYVYKHLPQHLIDAEVQDNLIRAVTENFTATRLSAWERSDI